MPVSNAQGDEKEYRDEADFTDPQPPPTRRTVSTLLRIDASAIPWSRRIWILLEEPSNHPITLRMHYAYCFVIIMSVASTVLRTEELESISGATWALLEYVEIFVNVLFSIEVLIRVACHPHKLGLLRNMYIWIDFAAVLPIWIVYLFEDSVNENMYLELLVILVPILRLLKITRHSAGWRILMFSITNCIGPLHVPAFLLLLMTVFWSCMIFWLEKHFACDPADGNVCGVKEAAAFKSVPHTMWFSIATISTVGYGDVVPNSDQARTVACFLIITGVCYMAMPLQIMGSEFQRVWDSRDKILMQEKTKARLTDGGITVSDLRVLFEATDVSGDGHLTRKEFIEMVHAFQLGMTPEQVTRLFKSIDVDNSGKITFMEFAGFLFPELDLYEDEPGDGTGSSNVPSWYQAAPVDCKDPHDFQERVAAPAMNGFKAATACLCTEPTPPETPASSSQCVEEVEVDGDRSDETVSYMAGPGAKVLPCAAMRFETFDKRLSRLEAVVGQLAVDQRRRLEEQRRMLEMLLANAQLRPPADSSHASAQRASPDGAFALPGAVGPAIAAQTH